MNSLHVKAFFEFLMDIENDYWTKIPTDPDPLGNGLRDGVAVEDDMALRALLPHIRPKRGRKRPEDYDHIQSPAQQRQRLSPTSAVDNSRPISLGNRPVQLTHDSSFLFADSSRPSAAGSNPNETSQTPLSRWPQSAITPTVRGRFWDDNTPEPRSAITPSRPKLSSQRRGPKNVSSAWKPGGAEGRGKVRGRPPINRTPTEDMREALTWWIPNDDAPDVTSAAERSSDVREARTDPPPGRNLGGQELLVPGESSGPAGPALPPAPHRSGARPARPSISLQVPERQGGAVRLATPPLPAVIEEGEVQQSRQNGSAVAAAVAAAEESDWRKLSQQASSFHGRSNGWTNAEPERGRMNADYYFERMEDRTNVDPLMAYLIQLLREGEWSGPDEHPPAEPASLDECTAIANATLDTMYRDATSSQGFFANLAGLAAGRSLMGSDRMRCIRLEDEVVPDNANANDEQSEGQSEGQYSYKFEWEYRLGSLKGRFGLTQKVPKRMWTRQPGGGKGSGEEKRGLPDGADRADRAGAAGDGDGDGDGAANGSLSAAEWRDKYRAFLLGEVDKRERELSELRRMVMESLTKG
jgi:hypothetical protein